MKEKKQTGLKAWNDTRRTTRLDTNGTVARNTLSEAKGILLA